jgi:hypothetical protein
VSLLEDIVRAIFHSAGMPLGARQRRRGLPPALHSGHY